MMLFTAMLIAFHLSLSLSDKVADQTEAHLLAWLGFIKCLGLSLCICFFLFVFSGNIISYNVVSQEDLYFAFVLLLLCKLRINHTPNLCKLKCLA